jgi:hypothetical protein
MKIKYIIPLAALAASTGVQAQRISIIGDSPVLGSADSTIVNSAVVSGAKTWQSGLIRTSESSTASMVDFRAALSASNRGETIVNSLQAAIKGEHTYEVIVQDKPIADINVNELSTMVLLPDKPQAIVWIHGDKDIALGTDKATYKAKLVEIQAALGVKMILVQSATQGYHFATRSADREYAAPSMAVAQAMVEVATEKPDAFILGGPMYAYDYCADRATPRAESMDRIGGVIGRSIAASHALRPSSTTASNNTLTITFDTDSRRLAIDTVNVAQAPNYGFDIWRGTDNDTRRLNITDIAVSDNSVTIITNETLNAGDRLIYGTSAAGVGAMDGTRGNLRAADTYDVNGATTYDWMPLFEISLSDVQRPGVNISGHITCDGVGVSGVAVSDGYEVTTTDADGAYYLTSNKTLGYVFYTLPSGYEPEVESNGWKLKIYDSLTSTDTAVAETHDFKLTRSDNDKYTMVVGADSHLANRNKDLSQFKKGYIARLKSFVKEHSGEKLYSTILGDMTWDQYWTANKYGFPEFCNTMTEYGYPLMLFPVIGNHDNDPSIAQGDDTDFKSAIPYRTYMSPSFYSFNLGQVHYIVLDDIVYINTFSSTASYADGVAGNRDYGRYITNEQLEWMRRDLELVKDKSMPVFILCHIPNWSLSSSTYATQANLENSSADAVARLVADFDNVHILSGHTHHSYNAHPAKYPNIHEHNTAAICATWWWPGKLVDRHICVDGTPGGFATYDVDGKNIKWLYRSIEDNGDAQMRVYDMNAVKTAYATDSDITTYIAKYTSRVNYANWDDNQILVNVFNYDTDWKVEILEDGTPLTVTRVTTDDPLHVISYDVPRYKAAATVTSGFVTIKNTHMFKAQAATADKPVQVRVTDSFGNVFTKDLTRPSTFDTTIQ